MSDYDAQTDDDTAEVHPDLAEVEATAAEVFGQSPTLGALAAALARAQGKIADLTIPKTETGTVTKGGVFQYEYRYADLAAVNKAVLPALSEQELAWTCLPLRRPDGWLVLRYRLLHSSGEWIGADYPLTRDMSNAQRVGGLVTYGRRYSIGSVTGAATEQDTDASDGRTRPSMPGPDAPGDGDRVREARAVGAIESDPSDRPATRVRAGDQDPEGARWTTDQGEPPEDQPGSAQGQDVLRSIGIACSDLGVTKRDERLHLVGLAMMAPRELESTDGLSLNEAREVLPGLARITRAQRDSMWDRLKALGTGEAADAKLLLTSWLEREVRSSDKIAVAEYAVITRELERAEEAEAAREAQEGETGTQEPARKGRPSQARRAAK